MCYHGDQVVQVVFGVEVVLRLIEVHTFIYFCSVTGHSLQCRFVKESHCLFDSQKLLPCAFVVQPSTLVCPQNSTPGFICLHPSAQGLLNRYCVSSILVHKKAPLAIWAIFTEWHMSDCSICT